MDQNTSRIGSWLIRRSGGYIKDGKQADRVLIGFVIVAIGISIFLLSRSLGGGRSTSESTGTKIPPETIVPQGFAQ